MISDTRLRLAAWLCGLLWTVPALSSGIYNFHHYDTDDGLPQVQVLAVHQDRVGYLWVGSYGGLSRYNGQTFRNYTTADGLASNVVDAIAVDARGRLWAGTGSGLCALDRERNAFSCRGEEGLDGAYVYALFPVPDGMWVGTGAGLYWIDDDRVVRFGTEAGLPTADVRSIARDDDGSIWVGTTGGLARARNGARSFEPVMLPSESTPRVSALLASDGELWIGTEQGLLRYRDGAIAPPASVPESATGADIADLARDANGALWAATNLGVLRQRDGGFELLTRRNGLRYDMSFSLYTGRDGLVWIGHDQGLTKWVPSPFVGYREEHGLLDPFVRTINEDHAGRLWLGTRQGLQILPYRDGQWRVEESETMTRDDGLRDERVYSIAFPRAGEALIATDFGVAHWRDGEGIVDLYTKAHGLPANQTQALLIDREGRVWIGTNLGAVIMIDGEFQAPPDDRLASAYVYRFQEDESGRVWAATQEGLFRVAPDGDVIKLLSKHDVSERTFWDTAPDGNGGMWAGSNGDGLFHVQADDSVEQFTTADGLADNFVWQVLQDSRGNVWAYTNRGLSCFDGREFTNYTRNHGLLHEEGGATGAWESHDGSLWFASADGLMRFVPSFSYPVAPEPRVIIERVIQDGRTVEQESVLPHRAGTLDFHFAVLNFWYEDAIRFRYRMVGVSDDWSEPMSIRPVTFGNLGGGEYRFEIQVRLPNGDWSEQASSFAFSVRPPYWMTPWFWTAVVSALILLIWLIFRLQLRRSETRRRELEAIVETRTAELKQANEQLKSASITDPLTGLPNRRFLLNQVGKDVAQSRRAYAGWDRQPNRDIIFMMIDLDHFKEINDTYGHLAGDSMLRQYAELIDGQLRDSDYVVRWGGEEFLVVARQAEATQCDAIAQRMIKAARHKLFELEGVDEPVKCTCSIGVSHYPFAQKHPKALNWEQIVEIADRAVYMAKVEGRDCWVAIHGTERARVGDGASFLRRMKSDLDGLVRTGEIRVRMESGEISSDKVGRIGES